MWKGLIEEYRAFLPVTDSSPVVTLQEGNTPLIPLPRLAEAIGCKAKIYAKYEGLNPTGSFKDRGMTMAVSKAKEAGSKAVICASTGNTSAAAAAYAARAGMQAVVLIPEGKIALGKLSQAILHGATVLQIQGNFDEALRIVRDIADTEPITLVNHLNPHRIQGQKTAAFEIIDQLGHAPDYHCLPVGNAGNITAYWMGYQEYKNAGKSSSLPKLCGFQAAGSAPIVRGHPIEEPDTIATAIRIGNPASWTQAEQARDQSGGFIDMVTDEEITEAQIALANTEGVFAEPASAAPIAGIKKHANLFTESEHIVATLTGHGLKDPNRAIAISDAQPKLVDSSKEAVKEALSEVLG